MSRQSLNKNFTHEGYDKVTKKDQDIEIADMSRHLKILSRQTIQGQEIEDIAEIVTIRPQQSLKTHK